MIYQITYFSPRGHVQKLSGHLQLLLPQDTVMQELGSGSMCAAPIQLVGFELGFRDLDALPEQVEGYIKRLEGKQVFLFATTPFFLDDVQRRRIHSAAARALPRECDYRGMFLCSSDPGKQLLEGFRHAAERKPESTRIRHWLKRCEYAVDHPNEQDLVQLASFAAHVLEISKDN